MFCKTIILMLFLSSLCYGQFIGLSINFELFYDFSTYDTLNTKKFIQTTCYPGVFKIKCERLERTFNQGRQMLSEITYDNKGNEAGKDIFEYNDNGKIVMHENYDDDGDLNNKFLYQYNKNKKVIEIQEFNGSGKLDEKTTKQYDTTTGFLLKSSTYDRKGKMTRSRVCDSIDIKGNCTKMTVYDDNGEKNDEIFTKYEYFQ